jgi:hypothetical protein
MTEEEPVSGAQSGKEFHAHQWKLTCINCCHLFISKDFPNLPGQFFAHLLAAAIYGDTINAAL